MYVKPMCAERMGKPHTFTEPMCVYVCETNVCRTHGETHISAQRDNLSLIINDVERCNGCIRYEYALGVNMPALLCVRGAVCSYVKRWGA